MPLKDPAKTATLSRAEQSDTPSPGLLQRDIIDRQTVIAHHLRTTSHENPVPLPPPAPHPVAQVPVKTPNAIILKCHFRYERVPLTHFGDPTSSFQPGRTHHAYCIEGIVHFWQERRGEERKVGAFPVEERGLRGGVDSFMETGGALIDD